MVEWRYTYSVFILEVYIVDLTPAKCMHLKHLANAIGFKCHLAGVKSTISHKNTFGYPRKSASTGGAVVWASSWEQDVEGSSPASDRFVSQPKD